MTAPIKIKTIRLMYSPEWQSWFWTRYDENDDQVGEADFTYRLSTAIADTTRLRNEDPTCADAVIEVYYRDGGLRKTL
jgi:hypothetical protein